MVVSQQEWSRRTFLSATTLASLTAAMPVSATLLRPAETLAIASSPRALSPLWTGPALTLSGDLHARLHQLRACLEQDRPARVSLFLDDADKVLFDIAARDADAALRSDGTTDAAIALRYRKAGKGAAA